MTALDIIEKYISFFEKRGHKRIPNSPLVPENDPTTLFTTAGMHPLVPYLLGEPHPLGKRLVGLQKCLRTDDIDEVGDKVHHTFFEMLGNWSLGDYWKKEAIEWSYEFLTSKEWLGIDKKRLAISVFTGDKDAPFDQESYDAWLKLGIPKSRIAKLPKKNNWWGPVGESGPCGPDTEMFIWAGQGNAPETFDPENPEWFEIWNDVFMEYSKTKEGKFKPLKQKNVDTGMGLERILAVLNRVDDDYKTELFSSVIQEIEKKSAKKYEDHVKEFRIIADHLRAAAMLIIEGIRPGKNLKEYVLRKLLRRTIFYCHTLGLGLSGSSLPIILKGFQDVYSEVTENWSMISDVIGEEGMRFGESLDRGLKKLDKRIVDKEKIGGLIAFDLYQTDGFPLELTKEILKQNGLQFNQEDEEEFERVKEAHQQLSRTASAGMFTGGLADHSKSTIKGHTATHLLHRALKDVLGDSVRQTGSNITTERIRFDFSFDRKLTDDEIKKIEEIVNQKIKENLPIRYETMTLDEARKKGAIGLFGEKYQEEVKVYFIDNFSVEICGGPHVNFTGRLKRFKIIKQENIGGGNRRIYAKVDPAERG